MGICQGVNCAITACAAFGSVEGESDIGGLVGWNIDTAIADSYSVASVTGVYLSAPSVSGVCRVGGLIGCNQGTVNNCYAAGLVKGQQQTGGLIGFLDATPNSVSSVINSFWDTQTSGQLTSDGGTGLTTAEMQTASTFLEAGWDFVDETVNGTEDIWWILEGRDYPRLLEETY